MAAGNAARAQRKTLSQQIGAMYKAGDEAGDLQVDWTATVVVAGRAAGDGEKIREDPPMPAR